MSYLKSALRQFQYYKLLGEKAMQQLEDEQLFFKPNEDTNSIAIIIQHLWGNMLSRWTDFKTTDGEKPWRLRDAEFEIQKIDRTELMQKWNEGWDCLFAAIDSTAEEELGDIIYIRNEGHSIMEAFNRQIAHYSYHVGQIVFMGKLLSKNEWQSLSIPRNKSNEYNMGKFDQEKSQKHFTDEWLNKNQ
ncbi:MAG: DUF1572 family protein [Bacteroidota bacterium]